ncbi:sec1 family domain-containing protein 2-like [Cebidichthys violaceus]|uniref:sec1 family domain-containing protein 2-like n=1 Tax=Cebidichthys violaceus TaxID=271503 RepID=UPI0035CC3759
MVSHPRPSYQKSHIHALIFTSRLFTVEYHTSIFGSVYILETPLSSFSLQATYRPFLRQILEEVFHPDRPECPDIEHTSGGLTDLLKTGFSMFMKVSRPHPGDGALLLLFLVGGVTPSELRLVREIVAAHKPGAQVLVLSTRLLRPTDVPELLFATRRLLPGVD